MAESSVYQLYRRIGDDIINSHERDLIVIARKNLYDRLSRVLTDYENHYCGTEDLYNMLAEIQNAWEDTITCQIDISDEQSTNTLYRECYDANSSTELEIICAKHALWIYGETGGERADFSNCLLDNVDLANRNLCAADFSGATLINCKLDDASMCDADFTNTKLKRCSLKHFTAEGADFKSSDFYNCDLRGAYFTHSNFTNAKIADCNFHESSFMNCCLESWICTDCNLNIANMTNVSYIESDWLSEANGEISMGGI